MIQGQHVKYVPGLKKGDYAIIKPDTLFVSNDTIYGVVYDSQGGCSQVALPMSVFSDLDVIENESESA
jgi:hypothetical protein